MASTRRELTPRERMVRSAAQLIRTKGVTGTGVREVVGHAGAPRGSVQHYFPEGKDQLVQEALLWAGGVAARRVGRALDRAADRMPSTLLTEVVGDWRAEFRTDGFDAGCPLVAAAADVVATSDELRATIERAFDGWQGPFAAALVECGVPARRAPGLALVVISALEGAIIMSRIRRDVAPLDAVVEELGPMLDGTAARHRQPRR
ncbi:MAG TPA: TetR/AcrR family transcriptional regulator [Acidimicrobiales bacterium]|nr:TetR/AcrR family transcriptional regulator [Acidimicrobiales bacterium]